MHNLLLSSGMTRDEHQVTIKNSARTLSEFISAPFRNRRDGASQLIRRLEIALCDNLDIWTAISAAHSFSTNCARKTIYPDGLALFLAIKKNCAKMKGERKAISFSS